MKKTLLLPFLLLFLNLIAQTEDRTFIPDDNFEQALIDKGYDDVLDDYVLTANIEIVEELRIGSLGIEDLTGIEDFVNLKILSLDTNQIGTLDLSNNLNLEVVDLDSNLLQELLLPASSTLTHLEVRENSGLRAIDISGLPNLRSLNVGATGISNLNLAENALLEGLLVFDTPIIELDLSNNSELLFLDGENMPNLTGLNLRNGNNTKIIGINLVNSPALGCIQVDDVDFSDAQESWRKDDSATYSEDCSDPQIDSDSDGISDDVDICPGTAEGETVDSQGCAQSQYADLAVQNVAIGLGSYLCSDTPNCTVDVSVLKDVDINLTVVKDGSEVVFDGLVGISNPLALENLTEGEYNVCATRTDIADFEQCYQVSSSSTENSVSATIIMYNPGQTYTLSVAGSQSYELTVNGSSTLYEFDSMEEHQLTIPLQVGSNAIEVKGLLDCNDLDTESTVNEDMEIGATDKLNLFPTLTKGQLTMQNNQRHQIAGISITGLNGTTVELMPVNGNPEEININLGNSAKGMYVVRIQKSDGDVIWKKIMIY